MSLTALFTQNTQSQSGQSNTGPSTLINSTHPPVTRLVDCEPDVVYQGNVNIGHAPTDSLVGVRGNLTIDTGCILLSGFLYGVQGKITLKGTVNQTHSEYNGALVGQFDFSNANAVVTQVGGLAMLWLDAGASAVAGILANASAIIITNSVAGNNLHSILQVNASATYFADIQDRGSGWVVGTTATTAAGTLKVLVNGATRYIQLFSAES